MGLCLLNWLGAGQAVTERSSLCLCLCLYSLTNRLKRLFQMNLHNFNDEVVKGVGGGRCRSRTEYSPHANSKIYALHLGEIQKPRNLLL